MDSRAFASAALALVLAGTGPLQAQQPAAAPSESSERLPDVLGTLDSGQRVRLHLPGRAPLDATYADVVSDSVFVKRSGHAASVALSRIERFDVARHPYRSAAGIGAAVGAAVGGVIGALAAGEGESGQNFESSPNQLAPVASVFLGIGGGALAGGGIGALVGAAITDWKQRYPPP